MDSPLNSSAFTRIHTDRFTGRPLRKWIEYADGVMEPVRKEGSLNKKYHGNKRALDWWTVDKPADWNPQEDGRDVSLNHDYGKPGRPGKIPGRQTVPAESGQDGVTRRTMELRFKDMGKARPATQPMAYSKGDEAMVQLLADARKEGSPAEAEQPSPDEPGSRAEPKEGGNNPGTGQSTLLRGAGAYHDYEARRQAEKEAGDKQAPAATSGKLAGADASPPPTSSGQPDSPSPDPAGAAAGAGAAGGMVKPKGQHGKGKLISEDEIIKKIKQDAKNNPEKVKEEGNKKFKELQQQRKNATSAKEKTRIKNQMENLKAWIKLFDRYTPRSTWLMTPLSKDQIEHFIHTGFQEGADKT